MPHSSDDDNNNNKDSTKLLRNMVDERESQIAHLHSQVKSLSYQLHHALQQQDPRGGGKRRHNPLSPHAISIHQEDDDNNNNNNNGDSMMSHLFGNNNNNAANLRPMIHKKRERMGRNASIATRNVLNALPDDGQWPPLAQRILDMFQSPANHVDYLHSSQFAKDVFRLCQKVRHVLEREPRVVFLQSPAYVFGDIHGNLEDLHFFCDNLWRLGMNLTAGNFVFLGDYVDRGLSCLECTAYLLAMKLQLPNKVFLLRGNHETRDVNGWEEHYGERSFIYQCRARFGDDIGYRIWEACNQVFDRLPLAAVIDQDIFCVHGGIPRPISEDTTRIQDILSVPKVAGINPPYEHEDDAYQQVASDCIWSDPASEEQEVTSVDPDTGFGESLRGGGAICFGNKAVTAFLQQHQYSYIMRAHEAHAEGVAISKGARVFTVFSTSKDHHQGSQALAGCMLVDNSKLQVINRSPAYRNQYVHRRDSVSVAALSAAEIQKRIKLGLVTELNDESQEADDDDEESDEEWEDFDETGGGGSAANAANSPRDSIDEESYVFDKNRRSSVDLSSMSGNIHDSLEWVQHEQQHDSKRHRQATKYGEQLQEQDEDEEIATVDGEQDVELKDA